MKSAWLFPGQGSQKTGMGLDLFEQTSLGREYFDLANEIMGVDLKIITFQGPENVLRQTQYTQPAIFTVSVILGKLLREQGHKPEATAGHSLGEYSALVMAGAFDFSTGLELVKIRAESMQIAGEQNPGTMAAVVGMNDEAVKRICHEVSTDKSTVVAANFNAPGQVVISGHVPAVHAAMKKVEDSGAKKVVELNVSGAFHSPLMQSAREALEEKLNSIEIHDARCPIYANVLAQPVTNKEDIRNALIRQLEQPVLWSSTIFNMEKDGFTKFVEVGPGRVLQGLNRRINRRLPISGLSTLEQLEAFVTDK